MFDPLKDIRVYWLEFDGTILERMPPYLCSTLHDLQVFCANRRARCGSKLFIARKGWTQ